MKHRVWLTFSALFASASWGAEPPPGRQAELINMLKHDCGSCHGLTLKGGLGPPLSPEALRNKPAEFLAATILYGRPGTPMPPWRPFLSDREVAWLVQRMLEGLK